MDLLLKRAEEVNFTEWLNCHGHLVKDIELDDVALDYVVELNLSYILTVAIDKSKDLLEVFSDLYPQYKENFMTVARQLKREGEKVGKIKWKKVGEQEKAIEVAQNMLSTNYSIEEIVRLTNLSKEEISQLGK